MRQPYARVSEQYRKSVRTTNHAEQIKASRSHIPVAKHTTKAITAQNKG